MTPRTLTAGLLAMALTLTACGAPTPSAAPDTLVIAGYGGSYEEAFKQSVIPDFEKSCSCKVTYIAGSSTDTVAKLKAQQGAPQIDVALIDDGVQNQAVQAGLLAKLDPKTVTNLPNVIDIARLPDDVGVGFSLNATGIAYNTDYYAKNGLPAPKKLADLENAKLKGKLVMPSITQTYGLGALLIAAKVGGGSEQRIDPGFAGVKKVAANAVTFDTTADVSNYFLQGQAVATVWGNSRVQMLAKKGFPIEFVYPEEGALPLVATVNVVNKAPHADLAQKFVNKLLEPAAQKAMAESNFNGPTVKGVTLDPALASLVVGQDRAADLRKLDWAVINKNRSAWTDRWNKEIETS
ncbi:putative spermidine/putrescine transport system substrate-binding protein [Nonomuraea solani]|uniref:Putative spermidine/putrescine transport system substrate-binding protein n=1 Tax=Nonomuraea solani TaxID=1144553 RepID=A0A1H6ETT9_9ACTN|nr:ABC transporter substrate-binding protein [Nonomuraea solani]SEH01280.1 putative spermidine/putrescine transport system substrate-binding protein [Nonomuraea solani]